MSTSSCCAGAATDRLATNDDSNDPGANVTSDESILKQAADLIARRHFAEADRVLTGVNRLSDRRSRSSLLMHASALESLSRYPEAAAALEAAESLSDDDRERARMLARVADLRYLSGQESADDVRAIAVLLERSVALDPSADNVVTRRKLCSVHFASRNFGGLLQHARVLASSPADEIQARLWAATACYFLNHKAAGQAELRSLLARLAALTEQQIFSLVELCVSYSDWDDALFAIEHALAKGLRAPLVKRISGTDLSGKERLRSSPCDPGRRLCRIHP